MPAEASSRFKGRAIWMLPGPLDLSTMSGIEKQQYPLRKLIHIVKWRQGCIVESSRGFYIAGANLPHHIITEAKTSRICRQGNGPNDVMTKSALLEQGMPTPG
ncbi:hypothetical protein AO069_04810 [Pseudomonas syringae pv. syringae PD2774]|nr:hypothetical protein AO069_04810 [Pseudomonas syringae pv. syringae PD2774]